MTVVVAQAVIDAIRREREWWAQQLETSGSRLRHAEEQAAILTLESQGHLARIADLDAWLAENAPAEAASVAA